LTRKPRSPICVREAARFISKVLNSATTAHCSKPLMLSAQPC
jgi:tetratricopeptide (TPR) repeat protein